MWAPLFLAALATATAAPAPTPAPLRALRVIVTVKSSTLCSAARSVALPIGYVNRKNEEAFSSINRSLYTFLQRNKSALNTSPSEQVLQNVSGDDGPVSAPAPINTVNILTMNRTAWQIAQNLSLESDVMRRSWKEYPKGKDENVDALRQRLQNMMDLQNALENRIMSFTQGYMDNSGGSDLSTNFQAFSQLLNQSLAGQLAALTAARQQSDPEVGPVESAGEVARRGTEADVVRELRLQENAFASEITKIGNACEPSP